MNQGQPVKSKFVALLWSIAMPGLGHLYLRKSIMGYAFIFITMFVVTRTKLNMVIFHIFSGNFKKANILYSDLPVLFFPAVYSFSMWHAYNYAAIAQNRSFREYRLTGFFFGLTIGGVPGSSLKFLGTYPITGLVCGIVTGLLFHLLEKLVLYVTRVKT